MGSYSPVGFAWQNRLTALITVVVVGPVMLVVYFSLLKLFRVSEVRDLLRPLVGRLGRGGPAAPSSDGGAPSSEGGAPPSDSSPGGSSGDNRPPAPERATTSVDTGLIPRISGEFDAVSFRAGPAPQESPQQPSDGGMGQSDGGYLPGEDQASTARGGLLREQVPLPGRRTFQGKAGENPYFKPRRPRKK
jgi:putative peptidoglycan lipid II flippase